jgi:hypothetical protein
MGSKLLAAFSAAAALVTVVSGAGTAQAGTSARQLSYRISATVNGDYAFRPFDDHNGAFNESNSGRSRATRQCCCTANARFATRPSPHSR